MKLTNKLFPSLLCLLLALVPRWAIGDEVEMRRIHISASLVPRIVAVDLDIADKLVGKDIVNIVILYKSSAFVAEDVAALMREKVSKVGSFQVVASVWSVEQLRSQQGDSFSALFLAEKLSDEDLMDLINMAGERQRMLFSPFNGDVEKGVPVGLSVENRIRPYFNLKSLQEAKIRMNEKLLGVSKLHE